MALCDAVAGHNVGVAVDVSHVWWDTTLARSLETAKGRVTGYHICNWLQNTRDLLPDRGMMGDGVADLRHIRAAVESIVYLGPCKVEVFSPAIRWRRDPGDVPDTMLARFRSHC